MKRLASILFVATFLAGVVACSPKLYLPDSGHANWVNTKYAASVTTESLSAGLELYAQYCQTCHYLHMPKEFTIAEWDNVFPSMSEKVAVADSTKQKIYYYIVAGAKDAK